MIQTKKTVLYERIFTCLYVFEIYIYMCINQQLTVYIIDSLFFISVDSL